MSDRYLYHFEELADDLPRPPLAALRALLAAGVVVSPKGWQSLSAEARKTVAAEGARDRVDMMVVKELLALVPVNQIKLVSRVADPSSDAIPDPLFKALGPVRPLSLEEWRSLRALDRQVLASLASNTRLLWRALDELAQRRTLKPTKVKPWSGSVAHCELKMRREVLSQIMSPGFLDGRAFVLARVSGRRAARRAPELFDLQAESTIGPVELDWAMLEDKGVILWQAHVSSWDGAFFPAGALVAATTAAVALHDMVKALDPHAAVLNASIIDEPWQVGKDDMREPATVVFSKGNHPILAQRRGDGPDAPAPRPSEPPPVWARARPAAVARVEREAFSPFTPSSSPPVAARAPSPLAAVAAVAAVAPVAAGPAIVAPAASKSPTDADLAAMFAPSRGLWFLVSIVAIVGFAAAMGLLLYRQLGGGR